MGHRPHERNILTGERGKRGPADVILKIIFRRTDRTLHEEIAAGITKILVGNAVEEVVRTAVSRTGREVDLRRLLDGVREAKGRVEIRTGREQAVGWKL